MPAKGKIASKRNDKAKRKFGQRKNGSDDEAYKSHDYQAKKVEKDPNAPKKPQTAYFLYMNAHRAEVKAAEPDLTLGELTKKMTEMYKALPEEEL